MNNYYLTLVIKPDLEDKERTALLDQVKKRMLGTDGKMEKEDLWGSRDLAYPINRQNKGFYAHFEFETDPSIAKTLDNTLKVEEDIIRFLLVRNDSKKPAKSKMLKKVEKIEEVESKE